MSDVREHILRAATRLFAERGFDGTPLQAVADAVGVRKPSVLYHFASKDALRSAVLDAMIARWTEVLPTVLLAAAKDRFDAVLDSITDFFAADPDRARLLMREALDRPDALHTLLATHVRPWVQVIAAQLARARERGHVQADADVDAYAATVVHLIVSTLAVESTLSAFLPEGASPERLRREVRRLARAGMFTENHFPAAQLRGAET